MNEYAEAPGFSDDEFDAIQAAVMETDRGRLFLNEYSHRVRAADTEVLLDAIRRLEDNMVRLKAGPQEVQDDLAELANAINATSDEICAVRNDMLEDKCAINPGCSVFSSLTADAGEIARALISTAEALQASAVGLKETAAGSEQVAAIDANVNTLFESGWRQDVLAQRISKAMGLLTHLQNSLAIYTPEQTSAPAPALPDEAELTEENHSYFAADAELFEDEEQDGVETARLAAGATAVAVATNPLTGTQPAHSEETLVFTETVEAQECDTQVQSPADQSAGAIDEADALDDAPPVEEAQVDADAANDEPDHSAVTQEPGAPETGATADNEIAADAEEQVAAAAPAESEIPAVEPRVVIIRGRAGTPQSPEAESTGMAEQDPAQSEHEEASEDTRSDDLPDPIAPAPQHEPAAPAAEFQATEIIIEEDIAHAHGETVSDQSATPADEASSGPARQTFAMAQNTTDPETISTDQNETLTSADANAPDARAEDGETVSTQEQPANDATSDVMEAFSDFAENAPVSDFPIEEAPQPELTPNAEEKERIVIIRKDSSEETSIPFADYLGIEEPAADTPEPSESK